MSPPHVSDNAEQDRAEGAKPKGHNRENDDGVVSQRAAAKGVAYVDGRKHPNPGQLALLPKSCKTTCACVAKMAQ